MAVPETLGNVVNWLENFPFSLNSQRENKPTTE